MIVVTVDVVVIGAGVGGAVTGGGVGATVIIMWTLQRYLPNDNDPYENYIKEEFDNEKLDK